MPIIGILQEVEQSYAELLHSEQSIWGRQSRRGFGMDAVKKYLEKHDSKIHIDLYGQGVSGFRNFAFRIRLPRKLYTKSAESKQREVG